MSEDLPHRTRFKLSAFGVLASRIMQTSFSAKQLLVDFDLLRFELLWKLPACPQVSKLKYSFSSGSWRQLFLV